MGWGGGVEMLKEIKQCPRTEGNEFSNLKETSRKPIKLSITKITSDF